MLHNPKSDRQAPVNGKPIDPGTRIGHVHLKVADLDRAIRFYCGVLGFEFMQQLDPRTGFVSAGGYHHLIALNTRESLGGAPPPKNATGLYHVAILYPTRAALADALRRLMAANVSVHRLSDHGISEAVYVPDPDGNMLELCWDRPPEQWPRNSDGGLAAFDRALDPESLLSAAEPAG